jgi:hypothetical protein
VLVKASGVGAPDRFEPMHRRKANGDVDPGPWLLIPLDVAHYSGMISPTVPI